MHFSQIIFSFSVEMSDYQDIQISFLNLITKSMPANLSLADELSDVLNISKDSAYRRLRGETTLSLNEVQKLSNHFGVSLDTLLNTQNDSVTFQYRSIDNETFTFKDYLSSILANLRTINQYDDRELTFLAKDIPPWHHFQFPRLSEFKCFFWMKTILKDPKYRDSKFEFDILPKDYVDIGLKIWEEYIKTPSIEVWSFETINITLRQFEFYLECGLFENPDDAMNLLDQFEKLLKHMESQAEAGFKYHFGTNETGTEGDFQLYSNEVTIADQTIFFKMRDTRITYLTHNNLNILTTTHANFCKGTEQYIKNMIAKSNLISTSSQKERNRFFNRLAKKVNKTRSVISQFATV